MEQEKNNNKTIVRKLFRKGELIVVIKDSGDYKMTIIDLEMQQEVFLIKILMKINNIQIAHIKVPEGEEEDYISILQEHPNVKYVELNAVGSLGSYKNNEKIQSHNFEQNQAYVQGELILVFKDKEDYNTTIRALEKNQDLSLIKMLMVTEDIKIAHFKVPIDKEKECIGIIQKHPNVNDVELNIFGTFK